MIPAQEIDRNFEDHAHFCQESLIVETEGRALVPMILSPGQVRLHQAIERQRQAGLPVRIIYLKSRRVQATTGTWAPDVLRCPDFQYLLWRKKREDNLRSVCACRVPRLAMQRRPRPPGGPD